MTHTTRVRLVLPKHDAGFNVQCHKGGEMVEREGYVRGQSHVKTRWR